MTITYRVTRTINKQCNTNTQVARQSVQKDKLGGQLAIHGTTICIEKPVLGVHVRSDYANPDEKVPQNGYKTC